MEIRLQEPIGDEPKAVYIIEVLLLVALLVFGGIVLTDLIQLQRADEVPEFSTAGMTNAEDLKVLSKSRDFSLVVQSTETFTGGKWDRDGQLFGYNTQLSDWVEWAIPVPSPGTYRILAYLTRAADYGLVQLSLNGYPIGTEIDLWARDNVVKPTGPVDLGLHQLEGTQATLRLEVVGKNQRNSPPHYQFGIDGITLKNEK